CRPYRRSAADGAQTKLRGTGGTPAHRPETAELPSSPANPAPAQSDPYRNAYRPPTTPAGMPASRPSSALQNTASPPVGRFRRYPCASSSPRHPAAGRGYGTAPYNIHQDGGGAAAPVNNRRQILSLLPAAVPMHRGMHRAGAPASKLFHRRHNRPARHPTESRDSSG